MLKHKSNPYPSVVVAICNIRSRVNGVTLIYENTSLGLSVRRNNKNSRTLYFIRLTDSAYSTIMDFISNCDCLPTIHRLCLILSQSDILIEKDKTVAANA
jgi:hypothetical protein